MTDRRRRKYPDGPQEGVLNGPLPPMPVIDASIAATRKRLLNRRGRRLHRHLVDREAASGDAE